MLCSGGQYIFILCSILLSARFHVIICCTDIRISISAQFLSLLFRICDCTTPSTRRGTPVAHCKYLLLSVVIILSASQVHGPPVRQCGGLSSGLAHHLCPPDARFSESATHSRHGRRQLPLPGHRAAHQRADPVQQVLPDAGLSEPVAQHQ